MPAVEEARLEVHRAQSPLRLADLRRECGQRLRCHGALRELLVEQPLALDQNFACGNRLGFHAVVQLLNALPLLGRQLQLLLELQHVQRPGIAVESLPPAPGPCRVRP